MTQNHFNLGVVPMGHLIGKIGPSVVKIVGLVDLLVVGLVVGLV